MRSGFLSGEHAAGFGMEGFECDVHASKEMDRDRGFGIPEPASQSDSVSSCRGYTWPKHHVVPTGSLRPSASSSALRLRAAQTAA